MLKVLLVLTSCIYFATMRTFFIRNRKFYDAQGGEIIFHGLNHLNKDFPFETHPTKQKIEDFLKMGMNGLRTHVSWTGYEVAPNVWNQTYLQIVINFVNEFGKRGIYTLLEFHQDLFGERTGGGGVPGWAVPPQVGYDYPKPVVDVQIQWDEKGRVSNHHLIENEPWANFYRTYAVNRGFKALYSNQYQLLDRFKQYWRRVARAFKDNPYIIAYQIINQPWPGNLYKNPLVMVPGLSQVFNLQGFHDQVARAIRQVDQDQNIGFEPVTWLNAIPTGYSHAPGGKQFADRSVFCFHYYSPPTYGMEIFMAARKLDMKRLGVGGLLTEFMAVPGTYGDPQDNYPQILNKCDKYHIGWFAWLYREEGLNRQMIVRTYAQRIGGKLVQQKYDPVTKKFMLYFEANMEAGQTIIFFSKQYYPNGFILTTDPKLKYEIRESRYIIIDSKNIGNRLVSVKIERPSEQMKGSAERAWESTQNQEKKQEKMQEKKQERKMMKQEEFKQQDSQNKVKKQQKRQSSKQKETKRQRSRSRSRSAQKKQQL